MTSEEYEVYATYFVYDEDPVGKKLVGLEEEFVGTLELRKIETAPEDMPAELEINGVVYKPQF